MSHGPEGQDISTKVRPPIPGSILTKTKPSPKALMVLESRENPSELLSEGSSLVVGLGNEWADTAFNINSSYCHRVGRSRDLPNS